MSRQETGGISGRIRATSRDRGSLVAIVGNPVCRFNSLTYEQLFHTVDSVAAGFLELGVGHGHRVGLVSDNHDLWLITNLALQSLGAVDVPRSGEASPQEIRVCLEHAGCRACVVESAEQADRLGDLAPHMRPLVVLRGEAPEGAVTFEELKRAGIRRLEGDPGLVARHLEAVGPDDLSTVIYTSGTTGRPKGVMLTHGNVIHNIRTVPEVLPFREGGRYLSFLPSWHSFERTIEYIILDSGMELHYGSKRTLRQDLVRVQPEFLIGVPRVYEIFHRSATERVRELGGLVGWVVRRALGGSRAHVEALRRVRGRRLAPHGGRDRPPMGQRLGLALSLLVTWPAHLLADRLLYRKVRAALGGRLYAAVSGGGPLPEHVDEFLTRAGLPLLNGYGLTETSPILCVRRLHRNVLGTIGEPLPETEFRIVGRGGSVLGSGRKGVIHARGPQVMKGYLKDEAATRRAMPGDGWLDTGDTGYLTDCGLLVIGGRAKDTIVLSGGENVEPEPLEARLASSPLISDALLVGHGCKTMGALLVPDFDGLRRELGEDGGDAELAGRSDVHDLLRGEARRILSPANGFRPFEQVSRVAVLPASFTPEDGTLTASMKKRRTVIEERYGGLLDGGPR